MLYFTTDAERLRTENHELITGLRDVPFARLCKCLSAVRSWM